MESLCRQPKPTAPEARQPGTPRPPPPPPHGPPSAAAPRIPPVNPSAPTAPRPGALRWVEVTEVRGEERMWGGGPAGAQGWKTEKRRPSQRGPAWSPIAAPFVAASGAPWQSPAWRPSQHPARSPPSAAQPFRRPTRSHHGPPIPELTAMPSLNRPRRCTHRCAPRPPGPHPGAQHRTHRAAPLWKPRWSSLLWQQGQFGSSQPVGGGGGDTISAPPGMGVRSAPPQVDAPTSRGAVPMATGVSARPLPYTGDGADPPPQPHSEVGPPQPPQPRCAPSPVMQSRSCHGNRLGSFSSSCSSKVRREGMGGGGAHKWGGSRT